MQNPAKRPRTEPLHWAAELPNRGDLERVARTIKEIGKNRDDATFSVIRSTEFSGLRADAAPDSLTSLARCQLACIVDFPGITGDHQVVFTVSCDSLLGVLRGSGKPQLHLRLSQRVDDSNLIVQSYDTFDESYSSSTTIHTKASNPIDPIDLDEMTFGWTLSMELSFFKALVKNNRDLDCDAINIDVFSDQSKETSAVIFTCCSAFVTDTKKIVSKIHQKHGETRHHLTVGDDDDGNLDAVRDVDESTLERRVHSSFDLRMLYTFLKSLDQRGKVLVMLQSDNPLLVRINLTDDQSYIYYLQASKMEDGEEDDD